MSIKPRPLPSLLVLATLSTACGGAAPPELTTPEPAPGLKPLVRAAVEPTDVEVTLVPAAPWLDQVHGMQRVSCDFRIHNRGAERTLRSIAVTVLDGSGAAVSRQVVDEHGIAPAIATIPDRALPAGGDLYLFNPFELWPGDLPIESLVFRFELADAAGARTAVETVVTPRRFESRTELALPLAGTVMVVAGNGPLDPHRRIDLDSPIVKAIGMVANSARYAVDLTPVDDQGRLFSGDGSSLDQWYGYHADVAAPAAGTVVFVLDQIPDNRMTAHGVDFVIDPSTAYLGNFIVIDHGTGEVSLFAHLAAGSFKVAVGDAVTAGQLIAQVGFSGSADFIHTHYQLMTGADVRTAEGVPVRFTQLERLLGATAVDADGSIQTGDVIRARARGPAARPGSDR